MCLQCDHWKLSDLQSPQAAWCSAQSAASLTLDWRFCAEAQAALPPLRRSLEKTIDVSVFYSYARAGERSVLGGVWVPDLLLGVHVGRIDLGMSVLGFEEGQGRSKWMGRRKWIGDCSEDYALPVLRGGKAAVIGCQPAISAGNEAGEMGRS